MPVWPPIKKAIRSRSPSNIHVRVAFEGAKSFLAASHEEYRVTQSGLAEELLRKLRGLKPWRKKSREVVSALLLAEMESVARQQEQLRNLVLARAQE